MLKCLEFSPSDLRHNAGTFVDRGFSKLLPGSLVRSLQYRKVDLLQPLDSIMSEELLFGESTCGRGPFQVIRQKNCKVENDRYSTMTYIAS